MQISYDLDCKTDRNLRLHALEWPVHEGIEGSYQKCSLTKTVKTRVGSTSLWELQNIRGVFKTV